MALKDPDFRIVLSQWRDMWIMRPQLRTGGPYVDQEPARMALMQIANCCGKHQDVTGGQAVFEYYFLHDMR